MDKTLSPIPAIESILKMLEAINDIMYGPIVESPLLTFFIGFRSPRIFPSPPCR
jgi:hypothetical protein